MDNSFYAHTGKISKVFIDPANFEDRVELELNGYYISHEDDKIFIMKLPTTYEECCNILGISPGISMTLPLYQAELTNYYKLLVCRNAWYKILDYDWEADDDNSLSIVSDPYGYLDYASGFDKSRNTVFRFPDERITDMFAEYFEDLFKNCWYLT